MPVREIDEALERAFASRRADEQRPGTIAGPHFPVPPPPAWRWPELVCTIEENHRERFEQLADQILDAGRQRSFRVFLITSALRAEGRTTVALALAKTLSRRPLRSLLVDADLRGPRIGRRLGIDGPADLDDVAREPRRLSEAVVPIPHSRAAVLPLRDPIEQPRAFLASPAWFCLMAKLKREYEAIVLDGGPLFAGLSATALHRSADAALLVVRPGQSTERAVLRAREVLDAGGVALLGLAENLA